MKWIMIISCGVAASLTPINWSQLKERLEGPDAKFAAEIIAENWINRPKDFFHTVGKSSWEKLGVLLSPAKLATVKSKELEQSEDACREFAKYLPNILITEDFPYTFRSAVYQLLRVEMEQPNDLKPNLNENNMENLSDENSTNPFDTRIQHLQQQYPKNIPQIINYIPASWFIKDGVEMMDALRTSKRPRLHLLNDNVLRALMQNSNGLCESLTLTELDSLNPDQLRFMSPKCMAVIKNLPTLDLSSVVSYLPHDVFAYYNGPLSTETIGKLFWNQISNYGSFIEAEQLICTQFQLKEIVDVSAFFISSRCLYGYLSQAREQGLGGLWKNINPITLAEFTPEMQLSWANIHLDDFTHMNPKIQSIIFSNPHSCTRIDVSRLTLDVMQSISASCLSVLLSKDNNGPVKLGELWGVVAPSTINSFTKEMAGSLGNVCPSDIIHMPSYVLQFFLGLDTVLASISKSPTLVILPFGSHCLTFDGEWFAKATKASPNMAGQLLLKSSQLPDDILSSCDGNLIRSLKFLTPGMESLDWKSVFSGLEKFNQRFDQIITLMSTKAKDHFCSTIRDLKEYLSIPWLGKNLTRECISAVQFNVKDYLIPLKAPELFDGVLPWREMLDNYSIKDWILFFKQDNLPIKLSGICEFWTAFTAKHQQAILNSLCKRILLNIKPRCTVGLADFLRNNPEIVSFLADDAFATHKVGQLPCRLKHLGPNQIFQLSKHHVANISSPTPQEISNHSLSNVKLDELTTLSFRQFQALISPQGMFIPKKIRDAATIHQYNSAILYIKSFVPKEEGQRIQLDGDKSPDYNDEKLKTLNGAIEMYLKIRIVIKNGDSNSLNFHPLIPIIRILPVRKHLFKLFLQSLFGGLEMLGLLETPEDLYTYLHLKLTEIQGNGECCLNLPPKSNSGFDLFKTIPIIESSPETFSHHQTSIHNINQIDDGMQSMRELVSQMLTMIKERFVTPGPPIFLQSSYNQACSKVKGTDEVNMVESNLGSFTSNASKRFVWGLSRRVGFIVGLFFGKALYLGLKLPFMLDPEFYQLLWGSNDKMVEEYYRKAYGRDIFDFEKNIRALCNFGTASQELIRKKLKRIECVRFVEFTDYKEAVNPGEPFNGQMNPAATKCEIDNGFDAVIDLTSSEFLEEYFQAYFQLFLSEFKEFIQEVIRGLNLALPPIKEISEQSETVLGPVKSLFQSLLNVEITCVVSVVRSVKFFNDKRVGSLIEGQNIPASTLVSAIILSLDQGRLERLLLIWIGKSKLSSPQSDLFVKFCILDEKEEGLIRKVKIRPAESSRSFYEKFTERLLGSNSKDIPDFVRKRFEVIPTSYSAKDRTLFIYLQPARELFISIFTLAGNSKNVSI